MASRILFEDEIMEQDPNKSTKIKEEDARDKGNSDQKNDNLGKSPLTIIHDQNITTDEDATEARLSSDILAVNNDKLTCKEEGKTNQVGAKRSSVIIIGKNPEAIDSDTNCDDVDNTSQDKTTDDDSEAPIIEDVNNEEKGIAGQNYFIFGKVKTTPLEKVNGTNEKKRQSESQLLGTDVNEEEDNCEVFGDDGKISKKYKLRKSRQRISYKEPKEWNPKELTSERDCVDDEQKSFICSECSVEFDSKKALRLHIRYHNLVLQYKCALCSETFQQNSDLIAHKATHTESFLCVKCKLAFSDHCDYLQHNLQHTNQTKFKCPECGLNYSKFSYRVHIFTHFDKKVSCPICPFTTNGQFNLKSHIYQHKYKLTCVECGKNCNNKSVYDHHMSIHTGVKNYQCFYCGKGFGTVSMRNVHTRIHTDERPYSCDVCGQRFRQSGDLKKHRTTHDSEKRFPCEYCNKKFYNNSFLKLHMRVHTRNNVYECPECDGTFTTAAGLKTHTMYKHLTDRPVECKVCNKNFVNQNGYLKHVRSLYHKRNMFAHETKKGNN